jgi:SAM-dependent methyltransferase
MKYVFTLRDDDLRHIRRHTFHLTADLYLSYAYFSERVRARHQKEYTQLARELDFWPTEGPLGVGFEFGAEQPQTGQLQRIQGKTDPLSQSVPRNVRISKDLIRYLQVCHDLSSAGMLRSTEPASLLEIGGGYGGLAALISQYNPKIAYTIVDLEDTQFFQAVNLAVRFGFDRLVLCFDGIQQNRLQPGLFYLVPQQVAESVVETQFDIAINQQSMQEMTPDQVARYCGIIKQCAARFYSCNLQHHSQRFSASMGLVQNLGDYLRSMLGTPVWSRDKKRGIERWIERLSGKEMRLADCNIPRRVYTCGTHAANRAA